MKGTKILIIEREKSIINVLSAELKEREGYDIVFLKTCEDGINFLRKYHNIDILMVDVSLAKEENFLQSIKREFIDLPVIITTPIDEVKLAIEYMQEGAFSYIIKPFFNSMDVRISIERAKEFKILRDREKELIETLNKKSKDLFIGSLNALVKTMEVRDEYLIGHSKNVAKISLEITRKMGYGENIRKKMIIAGNFHDIGRLGVRDDIMRKKGSLSKEEFEHIKKHPLISVEIISPVIKDNFILESIKHHHERYNGKGYPDGLKGKEIPLGARILGIADSFDAMTSVRPYREALSKEFAIEEIKNNAGTHFDPEIAEIFLSIKDLF